MYNLYVMNRIVTQKKGLSPVTGTYLIHYDLFLLVEMIHASCVVDMGYDDLEANPFI